MPALENGRMPGQPLFGLDEAARAQVLRRAGCPADAIAKTMG